MCVCRYKHSSTANWTQVRDSNALTAAVPPVFANLRIPPSYVLPGMIRPLYDQLSAASTVMAQTLKDIVQSAGLSAVGQQIVRLKVMQFTTFMNRQIAAHAFLNGVTSAGKSFGSRVAMNVGFTQFYRQVDQSSLRAPHHGTERFNHTIRFMNETADDLVGKAKGPGKSGPGGNGAGANTASVSATTLLTSMDSDKLVMERMTHTEKKTGLVTKQEFVLDMVVSGSQFQITLLGNLSGTEMSVPLSARLAPFVFSHPSGVLLVFVSSLSLFLPYLQLYVCEQTILLPWRREPMRMLPLEQCPSMCGMCCRWRCSIQKLGSKLRSILQRARTV